MLFFFFLAVRTMFYLPLSLFIFIPPSSTILLYSLLNFFYSLLHNFIIFPPQFFIPSSSFILYIFPSKYIDPLSTLHRPDIDPRLNFFQHSFVKLHTTTTFFHRHTTTFLLFSLHHHHNSIVSLHHHHHISIVFSQPPPHFYSFPKRQARFRLKRTTSGQKGQTQITCLLEK